MKALRFGILNYLNCLPATLYLERFYSEHPDLVLSYGTPSELNRAMREGDLDVSLVSSAEYIRHEEHYRRLNSCALWCDGEVESVCLYSHLSQAELEQSAGVIAVTAESATSVALTELLLPGMKTQVFSTLEEARLGLEEKKFQALLLIGDKALKIPEWVQELSVHDLGAWWKRGTQSPMTYAVWVARADIDEASFVEAERLFRLSVKWGKSNFQDVLREASQRSRLDLGRLESYYSKLSFSSTEESELGFLQFRSRLRARSLKLSKKALSYRINTEKVTAL